MEFKQLDARFNRFHYTIEDKGIRLIKKGISSGSNTFVAFEDIGSKIITEKSSKPFWLVLSGLFLIIAIGVLTKRLNGGKVGDGAEIFHLCTSFFFASVFFLTKKNVMYLTLSDNTNAIEFMGGNNHIRKTEEFIKKLLDKRDCYLLEKYGNIDEFLPYSQQYNNLVWLYNLELLTKEALQNKISELDALSSSEQKDSKNKLVTITGFVSRHDDEE